MMKADKKMSTVHLEVQYMPSQNSNKENHHTKHPSFTFEKNESGIVFSVVFTPDSTYQIEELVLTESHSGETMQIKKDQQEQTVLFDLDYKNLFSLLGKERNEASVTCHWKFSSLEEEESEENETVIQKRVVLTDFDEVSLPDMNPFHLDENKGQFFVEGSDLSLGLKFNQPAARKDLITNNHITDIEQNEKDLVVKGTFTSRLFLVSRLEASIENQEETMYFLRDASFELIRRDQDTHSYTYTYHIQLRCAKLAKQLFMEKTGDVFFNQYLLIHFSEMDAPLSIASGYPEDLSNPSLFSESVHTFGRMAYVFSCRFDASGKLQLCAILYDKNTLTYARERSSTIWLTRPFHSKEDVWLISSKTPYERSFNSWDFFRYVREQEPEKDVYYILDPSSPDWEHSKEEAGDRLLAYKSEEYIWKLLIASVLVTGGSPHQLYPFGTPSWDKYIRAKKVVLPDHLLGLSDERWTFNQQTTPWNIELLLTSSKTENRFASDSLGFSDSAIALTGLPHHAKLLEKAKHRPEKNVLLVVPQHQKPKWNSRSEQPEHSFLSLARNDAFIQLLQTADLTPVIVLPSYKKEEKKLFEAENWQVVNARENDLLDHFLESSILVTDYHPYTLDFGVLERPVFFYRPYASDSEVIEDPETSAASIRSYHNELPGEIAERAEDLIYLLRQAESISFEMSRKNRKKADALLENRDHQANERILEAIRNIR